MAGRPLGPIVALLLRRGATAPLLVALGAVVSWLVARERVRRQQGRRGDLLPPSSSVPTVATVSSGGAHHDIQRVLEHGLHILELASAASPRASRKSVRAVCERAESMLEHMERQQAKGLLLVPGREITAQLHSVQRMRTGMSGQEAAERLVGLVVGLERMTARSAQGTQPLEELLQKGDECAAGTVVRALEHALTWLEALSVGSPWKARKGIRVVCERVESTLASLETEEDTQRGGGALMRQLASSCRGPQLASVAKLLQEVEGLIVGVEGAGAEGVAVVNRLLADLNRFCDPVLSAGQLLRSADPDDCMRGLEVLRYLERVVLAEAVASEVSVVSVVMEMGAERGRSEGERAMAWMGAFALSFRNCESVEVRGQFGEGSAFVRCVGSMAEDLYSGRLDGREGPMVWASWFSGGLLLCELFIGRAFY